MAIPLGRPSGRPFSYVTKMDSVRPPTGDGCMKRFVLGLVLASFSAHAEEPAQPAVWRPISPQAKAVISSAVGDKMLDGVTAQYRWPKENINGVGYCGWVNSKNSYGAYTGFRPFYVLGAHSFSKKGLGDYTVFSVSIFDPTDDVESAPINNGCAKAGFDISQGPPSANPNDLSGAH